jgi:hypothetical protein
MVVQTLQETDPAARVHFCVWFSEAVRNDVIKPLVTSRFQTVLNLYSFFWVMSRRLNFMCRRYENSTPYSQVVFRNVGT